MWALAYELGWVFAQSHEGCAGNLLCDSFVARGLFRYFLLHSLTLRNCNRSVVQHCRLVVFVACHIYNKALLVLVLFCELFVLLFKFLKLLNDVLALSVKLFPRKTESLHLLFLLLDQKPSFLELTILLNAVNAGCLFFLFFLCWMLSCVLAEWSDSLSQNLNLKLKWIYLLLLSFEISFHLIFFIFHESLFSLQSFILLLLFCQRDLDVPEGLLQFFNFKDGRS